MGARRRRGRKTKKDGRGANRFARAMSEAQYIVSKLPGGSDDAAFLDAPIEERLTGTSPTVKNISKPPDSQMQHEP